MSKYTITDVSGFQSASGLDFARFEAGGRIAAIVRAGTRPKPAYVVSGPPVWPAYAVIARETGETRGGLDPATAEQLAIWYLAHGTFDRFDADTEAP